jgi:hypothetical protein
MACEHVNYMGSPNGTLIAVSISLKASLNGEFHRGFQDVKL